MAKGNLLVNGKNNVTARNKFLADAQARLANTNTASNVTTTPNLPTTRTSALNLGLQKAQQPVQTRLNNLNNATLPTQNVTSNNPAFVNGQLANQNNSRFIGFQQPNYGNTAIVSDQPQAKSFGKLFNGGYTYVPSAVTQAETANLREENKYRTAENALMDLQGDIYKNQRKLTKREILLNYPEFKDKIDTIMKVQDELLPINKAGQGVDMEQFEINYPELIQPKNLQDIDELKKQTEKEAKEFETTRKQVNKALRTNAKGYSVNGLKYLKDADILMSEVEKYKKNGVVGGATDKEILDYAIKQNPELQKVYDEMNSLELSASDKSKLGKSNANVLMSMFTDIEESVRSAAFGDHKKYTQEELQDFIDAKSDNSQGFINQAKTFIPKRRDTIKEYGTRYVLDSGKLKKYIEDETGIKIPDSAYQHYKELVTEGMAKEDEAKLEERKEKYLDPKRQEYLDNNGITELLAEGDFSAAWDKMKQSVAENPTVLAEMGVLAINPAAGQVLMGADVYMQENQEAFNELRELGATYDEAETGAIIVGGINAAVELFMERMLGGARWAGATAFRRMFLKNAEKELIKEMRKGTLEGIVKGGLKEYLNGSTVEGLEEVVQTIVSNAAKQTYDENQDLFEGVGQAFEGGFYNPMNAIGGVTDIAGGIRDNRENIRQGFNNALVNGVEGYVNAKEGVKDFLDLGQKRNKVTEDLVNKVKANKSNKTTKEDKQEETSWSSPKKGIIGTVAEGVTNVGTKVYDNVVEPIADTVAEGITSTTAPQDKLFKALNPSLNVLSRKKGNFDTIRQSADRANELIVEYGRQPTNTAEYYQAIQDTKKDIWNNGIQQGLDTYRYQTIDVKDIIDPVKEKMKSDLEDPLESLKSDANLLIKELTRLENMKIISLEKIEDTIQKINAMLERGLPPDASQIYEKGMRELVRQMRIQEDRMISEIPGDLRKFKKDYGALLTIEEEAQKRMIQDMKRKTGGNLYQNWGRIEGLSKMIKKGSFVEGIGQFLLGESLGKVKDTNFLIKSGFEGLKQQYKGGAERPESLKIKKKPPTPALPDKRTDLEKGKILEIDKRTKSNREEGYKTKNAVTSEKSAVTEKKPTPKKEEVVEKKETPKAEKELETRVETKQPEPKQEPKNKVTAQKTQATTKTEPKQEDKSGGNAFGLKKQKGSSRINNFTNVIKKIVDKYSDDIEGDNLFIELGEPYLPLEIDYEAGKKQLIVRHPNLGYDDPAIRFTVGEDGKLQPTGIKQAFMEQMMDNWDWSPIKETDELLHTWAVNLEDQYLNERNIDEDTGVMKEEKSESAPKEEVKDRTSNANIINNIKSFEDIKDLLKPTKAGAVSDWEYEGELNGVKTRVWNYGDTIFIKYGEGQGPAQARIDIADKDHIDQLKELLSEINNDGEILESNRNNPYSTKTENTLESELPTISLDNIKNAKSYSDLMDLFDKSTHEGIIPRSDERIQYKNTNYVGKVGDKDIWIWEHDNRTAIAIGEGLKKTEGTDNLGYERPTDIEFKSVFDIDDIKNEIEKAVNGTKTTTEITGEKTAATSKTVENKPKNLVTNRPVDNSSITGRFRNLTLDDYKKMQGLQGVEKELINNDIEGYTVNRIKNALLDRDNPLLPEAEIIENELDNLTYEDIKKAIDTQKQLQIEEQKLMKSNPENLSQQIEDLRYDFDEEMLSRLGIYNIEDADKAVNAIKKIVREAETQFKKDNEIMKSLVEKYGKWWEQGKTVDNGKNTNIIGKNNSLTTKNNQNDTNLGRSQKTVGGGNGGNEGGVRNAVSNMQPNEQNQAGLQRASDTNGNGQLNTSREQADISGNGLTAGSESTRLTVGQQRKINEDSRNILEKHNFSINRSDYTPEELDTLFKYEGNGGLAKAGDENIKGTRYEFYTPKNAVSALQRGIQKYSDSPINSVEDPTAGKGNMVDGYGDNIDKYMYEISPVSGTIAKLRFPEAKVGIGEKDGDFQRRYLNYQGQKAYDTPRDGGHNVDAILLNPPFGKRITIKDEPQIKSLEDYFTKRSIEHDLKDGGMVGLLMPSRWLKADDSYTKRRLDGHTQIVDAYRLPAGVFSYTDVGTDLIILKKVAGADNKGGFVNDSYFKANPDKVLGVEKQRTGRHGMETYIDGDPKVIDTLWQDTDIVPSKMNAITDTTKKTAVTAKSAPVENKPKNLVTNPPKEEVKFTPTETTDKPKAEKKPTTRKSKNAKQTISKGDKTDVGTYTVNGNEKAYDYQDATDADGFIDRSKLSISPAAVADGVDLLNYIDGKIQTDYLYFSGNIYAKLKQLEKDKPQMSDAQYKKQKEGLEAILPSKLSVGDITWSPTDKALMDQETDIIYRRRDRDLREDVEEKMTIKNAFKKRLNDLPSSQFQGTDTSYWKISDYIDGKRWSSERLTKRYNETDEEFEARKKAKKAEEEVKKQATKERAKTFFNDFIKEQLSPEIQNKITESYNTRLRAVVKPDYKNMPLSVKNMSATFHGKPLKIDPVQIEGINAMLSKGTMLIAHGVGYGKTLEGVVATIASVQKGWTKKPLFIVPKGTREDWIKTIHDLFPNQEIVDLGGLTVDDIKRLKRDLGNDVKNWIKDGQVAIITHNGFDNKINFKWNTQLSIESDLRDVMDSDNNTARQEDSLAENIQNIAETVNAKKDTKKLKGIKATLSDKYGDELLEELDQDLEKMSEVEFVENFVSKAEGKFKEEELRKDAHDMYETKPIYIEDLGIDHITIDEVHNYKNIFTSAKSNYKKGEGPEEVNPYGKISGSSSARGRKMFATAQYILKNNDGRGVFSLSATPFNNQPIEVYNMLSLHAYNRLVEKGIQNINSFFDYFANFRSEWISNPLKKGGGEFGEVMKDFNNLPEMQRLVGEYIDYVGDNPNLVRPEKRMKKVILTPSDMQREIQQRLQQEEKRMNANGEGDSVLPIYNDMRLNIISPYLTSYGKLYDTPTWQEFIESSPKLKFAVDTIKALRDEGQNDGVFIYMPLGVEYHSLLKEAIENMVGKDRVKVGIINGTTTGTETVDGEKVEKRIAIADRFRKGELNVLIGGRNTSEGINLQDNGFITINTLIGWNPTEITQLNGRIHRQGNLRDHVIELLPLLTDGADIMMMQKYDEKANRINNIFESQGRTFNLEELDPEEEKMALNTDPVRKAELSIDMDKKRIQRDIQKLSSQNGTLKEIVTKMPKEETIKEQQERISKAQEELKQINEGMKSLDQDSAAYRTLESQRDYTERNIKGEKERLKALEKDKTRAEARMQQYAIDTLEGVNQRISENDAKLDDLIEQEKNLQNELKERIEKYTKEQEEWRANMKTPEDYIGELKEDFRSKKIFADREELKSHLEEQKSKKNVLGTEKNKVTTQAARANRPSIRMNVEEREKKNATANPMNKVTSKKPTNNSESRFSPELVEKIDKIAESKGIKGNTIKKMKVLNKTVDKGKGYHTETENEIYELKKQIITEYVKSKGKTIKDKGQNKTIVDIKQGKTRVHWHVVGKLYRDLKREGIIK